MSKSSVGIVAAISAASAEDLEQIRKEIAEAADQLNLLRTAERLLAAKLEPREPGSRAGKAMGEGQDALAVKIEDWLRANGPHRAVEIAEALGCTPRMAALVCAKSAWFTKGPGCVWSIATGG